MEEHGGGRAKGLQLPDAASEKEISRLYRYYSQLADLGENLYENEKEFLKKSIPESFGFLRSVQHDFRRRHRCFGNMPCKKVRDVYQSEIGIRQNNVMKVLTIVTTVFFAADSDRRLVWHELCLYAGAEMGLRISGRDRCKYPSHHREPLDF